MDQLEQEISTHFTETRVARLVLAVRTAYDRALLDYSPEDGWDAQLFGFTLYKYIQKRLLKLCSDPQLGFEIRSAHPAFRLGVGPFTLASYGCGQSGTQDIHHSFPNNENGAPALVELNQFCLELEYAAVAVPRALILAHLGNPANGLEALYLATPGGKQDGRINEWSYTQLLYKLDSGNDVVAAPDLPPPAPFQPATLTLKLPVEKLDGVANK